MEKKFGRIETIGNRCFVGREYGTGFPTEMRDCYKPEKVKKEIKVQERKKPEKVNLKFGKIRVQVTGAGRVKVKEDQGSLIILLE